MLTPEQLAARAGKITASRAHVLVNGDDAGLLNLWREMVDDPAYEAIDLSDVWPVQLGSLTEGLNLDWYENRTGRAVMRRGEVVVHPELEWAACTLDGFDGEHILEAKHVSGREPRARIIERYAPQCVWQRIVTGYPVLMSIIEGAAEPVIEPAAWDEEYAAELLRRAEWFMGHVWDLTPPVALPPVAAPVPVEKWRSFDLTTMSGADLPNWASPIMDEALRWAGTVSAAKRNASAAKEIKALLPDDVGLCVTAAAKITRSKNGAISIREV